MSLEEQVKIKDDQIRAKANQINGLIQANFNFAKALNPSLDEVAATTVEVKKGFLSKIFKI